MYKFFLPGPPGTEPWDQLLFYHLLTYLEESTRFIFYDFNWLTSK